MNDSSELVYGLSLARQILSDLRGEVLPNVALKFLNRGEEFLDVSKLLPGRQFFAFCFCEAPDLLSQWRTYADRGGGYAIGFDKQKISHFVAEKRLSLFPMEYGPGTNSKLLSDDIRALVHAFDTCNQKWPGAEKVLLSAAVEALKISLIFRLFWLKHPGFAEEKEWRILAEPGDLSKVRFRQGQGTLVPYIELDLPSSDKMPIQEITHGPSSHPLLAAQALEWLLKENGLPNVEVHGSVIPLRA